MMDIQTGKLNAIGYLIAIEDGTIFSRIESSIIEGWNLERNKFNI